MTQCSTIESGAPASTEASSASKNDVQEFPVVTQNENPEIVKVAAAEIDIQSPPQHQAETQVPPQESLDEPKDEPKSNLDSPVKKPKEIPQLAKDEPI